MRNASTASYPSPHGTSTRVIDLRPRRKVRTRRWDGTAWVFGIEFTGLNSDPSKPYIHLDVSNPEPAAYESTVGYFTNAQGRRQCHENIEIYEKAKLVEPPHVTRF